ncbi:MAG: DUF4957 domain-containing protein [Bacteroidales bacterium]|nr:DUF4957 domain-containing protein [Bacteroidales bacterium]
MISRVAKMKSSPTRLILIGETETRKGGFIMKNSVLIGIAGILALSLFACTKENDYSCDSNVVTVKMIPVTLKGQTEETKTEFNNQSILWHQGDKVAVIARYGESDETMKCEFTAGSDGETTSFSGELPEGTSYIVAVYPYDAVKSFDMTPVTDNNDTYVKVNVTLPAEQIATAGSYDPAANITVAKAEISGNDLPVLNFAILGALLKVTVVDDDVCRIVISSDANMSGEVVVKQYASKNFPNASNASSELMSKEIVLHNNGDIIERGTYYIVTRFISNNACTNFKALQVHTDLTCSQRQASSGFTIARKAIINMGSLSGLSRFTNLYYSYCAGLDIPIGNKVYNKGNNGEARLVTGGTLTNTIVLKSVNGEGVLFLNSGGTYPNNGSIGINTDVVISSTDPSDPAVLQPGTDSNGGINKYWNLQKGSLVLNGVILDCTNLGDGIYFFSNSNATEDFNFLGLYNCKSTNIRRYLYSTNGSQMDKAIKEIVIDHCVLGVSVQNSSALINPSSSSHTAAYKFEKFTFTNNVLYDATGSNGPYGIVLFNYSPPTSGDYYNASIHGKLGTHDWPMDVVVENNILYNAAVGGGSVKNYRVNSVSVKNNLNFVTSWTSGTPPNSNLKFFDQQDTSNLPDFDAGNNAAYGPIATDKSWTVANAVFLGSLSGSQKTVTVLSEDPFQTAVPATGVFVLKPEYSSYGPQ